MNLPTKYLSEPRYPYGTGSNASQNDKSPLVAMTWHDGEHTPDNKRAGQVKSICELKITRCPPNEHNAGWLQVEMLEITTSNSGRTSSRTITTVLQPDEAKRIANFILTGA